MKRFGYKVMGFDEDGETIRAGANSSLRYSLEDMADGKEINMPGNGCYLALSEEYVMDYYSGLAEKELLLKLEFDISDITTGDITDREPELSLKKVKIIEAHVVEDGEILYRLEQKQPEVKLELDNEPVKNKRATSNRNRP